MDTSQNIMSQNQQGNSILGGSNNQGQVVQSQTVSPIISNQPTQPQVVQAVNTEQPSQPVQAGTNINAVQQVISTPATASNANSAYLAEGEYQLPVGITDSDGVFHNTIRLTPMTGETEEAIADPKVRDNGGKLVTELIFSVTEGIGTLRKVNKDVIRQLSVADRDYILMRNRQYSIGDVVEYQDSCPHCRAKNQVSVDLNSLPVKYLGVDDSREMTFDLANGVRNNQGVYCKHITIRLPIGTVQERIAPIARVNPAQATSAMLHLITKSIEGIDYLNPDVFKKMTKKDRDLISKKLSEFNAGVELSTEIQCASCGENYTSAIPLPSLMGE